MFYRSAALSLACFCCASIHAQETRPSEAGFSGDLLLGGLFISSQSQMNANDENKQLDSFDKSTDADTRILPGVLGNVYYTFDSLADQVYLGVSRSKAIEGQFSPEIGYRRLLSGRSSFTLAYIPNIIKQDTYADPFVINQRRDETDQSLSAVRAKWESIVNSGIGVELAYGDLEIEKELSGDYLQLADAEKDLLKRDAKYSYASVEMKFPIAKGIFLAPSIYGFDRNAEGDAYSHQAAGIELALFATSGRHKFSANIRHAEYRYDASNPVFDRRRKDNKTSVFAGYFYDKPFGWENSTYTVIANAADRSSNINFYESESFTVATGINWKF